MKLDDPFFPVVIKLPPQIVIDPPLKRPASRRDVLTFGCVIFTALFLLALPSEQIHALFGNQSGQAQRETYLRWRTWMGMYCQEQAANGYQEMSDNTRERIKEKCSEMARSPILAAATPDQAIIMMDAIQDLLRKGGWGRTE